MRRRLDPVDHLLEAWAGWRVSFELYTGTGDSPMARLLDPASTRFDGSRVLWSGHIHSQLSALNSALVASLGVYHSSLLATLYGTPGTDLIKSQRLGVCCRTLSRVRQEARRIVAAFVPEPKYPGLTLASSHYQEEHHEPMA